MTQKIGLVFSAAAAFAFAVSSDWPAAICLGATAVFLADAVAEERASRLRRREDARDLADLWRRDRR